jgi:proline iminopeptidase
MMPFMLDVGDGHAIYWEERGNPAGKPAVVLHGGPGSGCAPWWSDFFNLDRYRVVMFDQRGCGRSRPHTLEHNTTQHLIADVERLREHLAIERWLVLGGSWGSVLGLAYAQAHPERVSELVLFAVGTGTRREVEWITRDVGRLYPAEWARFRDGVPEHERDGSLVDAYYRLLTDRDPAIHERAARDWCAWEDAHVGGVHDPRYDDPAFRLCFARLVTHYWRHTAFLEDGQLMRGLDRLADIPGVLIHGLRDFSSPPDIAWDIAQTWGELELVADEGHGGPRIGERVVAATNRFLRR